MRKIYVEVKVRLILRMNEGIEVEDVITQLDYNFTSQTEGADIEETDIRAFEVTREEKDEQQRRDEKNGLYPEHEDIAN